MFLESLCYRMQGLSTTPLTEPMPKNPDGPYIFRMVLESIRKSHERRLNAVLLDPSIIEESNSKSEEALKDIETAMKLGDRSAEAYLYLAMALNHARPAATAKNSIRIALVTRIKMTPCRR